MPQTHGCCSHTLTKYENLRMWIFGFILVDNSTSVTIFYASSGWKFISPQKPSVLRRSKEGLKIVPVLSAWKLPHQIVSYALLNVKLGKMSTFPFAALLHALVFKSPNIQICQIIYRFATFRECLMDTTSNAALHCVALWLLKYRWFESMV